MKTAFVTGGTGFLGFNLIRRLVEDSWQVMALHRKTSNLKNLKRLNVQLRVGNITDIESLDHAMPKGVDAVFHTAANVSHWSPNNAQQTKDNVGGTRNMVATALKRKARRFIHTSSIAAFGFHSERINEETSSNAERSWINYFRTKRLAELEVYRGIEQGLDGIILNPCNIMGPYDYHNLSRMFTVINQKKILGIPTGKSTFCHVREVAKAHITAVEKGRCGHHYILGGADASYLDVVQQIGQLLGCKVPKRATPAIILRIFVRVSLWGAYVTKREPDLTPESVAISTRQMISSSEKAEKELGYRPVSLSEILADCHSWMVQEGLL